MEIKSSKNLPLGGVSPVDAPRRVGEEAARSGGGSRAGSADSGDRVTLTSTAQRFLEATSDTGSEPPIDRAKVESIRQAIAEGRYPVDPERIAAKMLAIEADLPKSE